MYYKMRVIRPTPEALEIKTPIEAGEIYTKRVNKYGNGAKIDFIKSFIGRKVIIVVLKENGK
jgi:putative transposon-encoded protein